MSLLVVREQFARQTGRYDLVTSATTFTDNGADFYIKAGQRMLDRMLNFPKEEVDLTVALATNTITTVLANVMTVLAVAVQDSGDGTLRYLNRRSLQDMRDQFGDEDSSLASVDTGEPRMWGLGWIRDDVVDNTTTAFGSVKLVTMPPADKGYNLLIQAKLQSSPLTSDTSESFWSEEHPDILVMAAQYKLEASYRNFQGSQAALATVRQAVEEIYYEVIEQMQVDATHLKDSHRFINDVRSVHRSTIG